MADILSFTGGAEGKVILSFTSGGKFFQVVERHDGVVRYEGYCNGLLSVTGDRADVVARALEKKNLSGQSAG